MTPAIQQMFAKRGPGDVGKLVFPARGTDNKPHYMISHIYYDTVMAIGVTRAKRLAKALNAGYKVFL